jgi:hypothetical protein
MRIGPLPWLCAWLAACGGGGGAAVVYDPCRPLALDVGGSASSSASVSASSSASTTEVASVAAQTVPAAIALWNEGSDGETHLVRSSTFGEVLLVRPESGSPVIDGDYDPTQGAVDLNLDLGDSRARAIVLAHEIGHAYGLSHVDPAVRASVMNPGNTTVPPGPGDTDALIALWGDCRVRRPP